MRISQERLGYYLKLGHDLSLPSTSLNHKLNFRISMTRREVSGWGISNVTA
jgi:hypothetical protein